MVLAGMSKDSGFVALIGVGLSRLVVTHSAGGVCGNADSRRRATGCSHCGINEYKKYYTFSLPTL